MAEYIVTIVTLLPLVGALYLAVVGRGEKTNENDLKWTALVFSLATFFISLALAFRFDSTKGLQFETNVEWIKAFDLGVRYHVGVDGLSLWLVLLTTLLVPLSLISSWNSIHKRQREFLISILALETGMIGVFVAKDFFLFYLYAFIRNITGTDRGAPESAAQRKSRPVAYLALQQGQPRALRRRALPRKL